MGVSYAGWNRQPFGGSQSCSQLDAQRDAVALLELFDPSTAYAPGLR
jgi:hypothetical protein